METTDRQTNEDREKDIVPFGHFLFGHYSCFFCFEYSKHEFENNWDDLKNIAVRQKRFILKKFEFRLANCTNTSWTVDKITAKDSNY